MDIWKELERWYSKQGLSTAPFFERNSTEVGRDELLFDFAQRMLEKERGYKDFGDYHVFYDNPDTRVYLGGASPEDYMWEEAEQKKRSNSLYYYKKSTGEKVDELPEGEILGHEYECKCSYEFESKLRMGYMGSPDRKACYNVRSKSAERLAWIYFLDDTPEAYDARQEEFRKQREDDARNRPFLHNLMMVWNPEVGNETYYVNDEGKRITLDEHVALMKAKFGDDVFELAAKNNPVSPEVKALMDKVASEIRETLRDNIIGHKEIK